MKTRAPAIDPKWLMIGAGALALFWFVRQRNASGQTIGYDIGSSAAEFVGDVGAGAVIGIGKTVGIPETNHDACSKAKAAGDTWEASFACPAGDFLGWWWNK